MSFLCERLFLFCLLLFPTHTVENPLLPLLEAFSDVIAVQLVNLMLSEEKASLLLSEEPGSTSHRGMGRLKQVLEEPQLASPIEQLLLPGRRGGEGGAEPLGNKGLPHCWRELSCHCRFHCLSVKVEEGKQT